jgi:hypothetical protein
MPDIAFTPLEDDDALNAASLNTPFTAIQAGINGIMEYGLRRGALSRHHLGQVVMDASWMDQTATPQNTLHISGGGTHFYPQKGAGYVAGTDNLADRYVIGAGTGVPTYSSDNVLQFDHAAGVLLGMSRSDRTAGILVLLNVEFDRVDSSADTTTGAVVAIQFETTAASGTWHTIDRTERYFSATSRAARQQPYTSPGTPYRWVSGNTDYRIDCDMALRTLIAPADITAAGANPVTDGITGVRAVIAIPATSGTIQLGRTQFTIVPLHAEVL